MGSLKKKKARTKKSLTARLQNTGQYKKINFCVLAMYNWELKFNNSYIVASKNIKYLGINLLKDEYHLYTEN